MTPSSTVEDYLKRLYLAERGEEGAMIAMGRLATAMGVVPGTATSMVKALAEAALVEYRPRSGVRLTPRGRKLALHVLRRHRLIELFLVEILGLDWSVVHEEAELLEHAISDRVLARLDDVLGHPAADPHGDPIPTPAGRLREPRRVTLADAPIGAARRVVRVLDQDPAFLQFVQRRGLVPGTTVTVLSHEPAADALQVRPSRHRALSIGLTAARRILVGAARAGATNR